MLLKSIDQLKKGEEYTTPSGWGGSFTLKYMGFKNGKHEFKNMSKEFKKWNYSYTTEDVLAKIHQKGTSIYQESILTYDDFVKLHF